MLYHSAPSSALYPTTAQVTYEEKGGYSLAADGSHRNLPLYQPRGFQSLPCVGDEVLVQQVEGRLCVIGTKVAFQGIEPGEVKITSSGGASIHLKNDGSISLNGLVITKEGVLKASS